VASVFVFSPSFFTRTLAIRPGPNTSKVLKANPPLVDVPRSPSLFRASALYGRQSLVVLLYSFKAQVKTSYDRQVYLSNLKQKKENPTWSPIVVSLWS
jgi:hypothetical protein